MPTPPPIPPTPVQTLSYDQRLNEARPGIITAMGVLSVVIGCISGLMSLSGIFSTMMFFAMTKMPIPGPPVAMPATPTLNPGSPTGSVTVGGVPQTIETSEDTMSDQQRAIVVATLSAMSNLSEPRVQQLNLLLSVSGQKVFPFADRITHQLIRSNVTEHGTLPSTSGEPGATYFLVGTGRLELYDDHAVFRPDGSSAVVSATTNPSVDEQDASSGASSGVSIRTSRRGGMTRTTVVAGPAVRFSMSKPAMIFSVLTSIASLGVAIYLLVIGIMVLRDSLSGRKLHWIYVGIKIPLVLLAAAAAFFVWNSFGNSIVAVGTAPGSPPPPPGIGAFMAIGAVFSTLFGLAYPVALIFVLMSRTVKQYYSPMRYRS